MATRVKLYRQNYRDFLLLKEDLQHLIELFQTYCRAPTILIDGMRIEHPNDLNFLTQPLASEIIATGFALYPTMVNPTTGIGPLLQLRITKGSARLFVNVDARGDFQELINQIGRLLSKNDPTPTTKQIIGGMQGGIIGGMAGVEFPGIAHLGIHTLNYILFFIINVLWTSFSVGLAAWFWSTLVTKIAPHFALSLDDVHARKMRIWRKRLNIVELVMNIASFACIYAFIYFFWGQMGFH